ncbi:TPA: hypothetical protein GX533_02720 [Candidatus Dojkabacteria bacterium]|uniref:Uncharacterized protein n=1 Tax=Candidatus Dojkabacteria bacterium TaxID=2099670 RepID=A0A832QFI8_9BACT|nr:hypothetical protein [Candidatus Dojkabacteria bacterium]
MSKKVEKNKLQKIVDTLPNPKILTILAIAIIIGVTIYLIILLFNLK